MMVNMERGGRTNGNGNGNPKLARAIYTNTPEAKSELFFRKGDILSVIEFDYEGQKGWWLCTLLGERGICPGNYLELLEHDYQNQDDDGTPAYDVPKSYQPNVTLNPSDLYDVPKNQLPIYNSASLVRSKKHGSDAVSLGSTGSSNRVSSVSSSSSSSAQSSDNSFPGSRLGFQRHTSPVSRSASPIYANEATVHDLERLIQSPHPPLPQPPVQPDTELDYDIPRASLVAAANASRPPSSLSAAMSGSRGGLSVASGMSESSKDSLSELYDVPRSVKNCVSIFENKYDQVQHRPPSHHRRDPSKRSSISSTTSSSTGSCSNPQSSIERHFGLILRNAGSLRNADSICSRSSKNGSSSETYDVVPPTRSRNGSLQSWSASTSSNLDQSYYDMPAEFSRQVSMCGSTETLSCPDASGTGSRHGLEPSSGRSSTAIHLEPPGASGPAEVKILPLCPKAAVTICEKLRQEVLTAINSILSHVKPKWRMKDNLKEIMPELRFGCVRLNLGVKDFTDFCSRTVSNGKKFGLEPLVIRLQKLLAPLSAGSQILQKDVDELEAYLWSVDRLSVAPTEKEVVGDALDQLVLCARSLQHDTTEIANFIALNSSPLFQETGGDSEAKKVNSQVPVAPEPKCIVEDTQEDYDYVTLSAGGPTEDVQQPTPSSVSNSLDSRDQQILEFYAAQIGATGPLLSQSISTFISSVHQNDPPKAFNGHLKYVILLAYKMLFAGDTIHRNISNVEVKEDVEMKADELHKAVVALHEASKLATRDFPKILPMQNIIEHVWSTTSAAAQLKKVIFSATL